LPALALSQKGTPEERGACARAVQKYCKSANEAHAGAGMFASQSCEDRRRLQQALGQPRPVTAWMCPWLQSQALRWRPSSAQHTTGACDFPQVPSRQTKTGSGKEFMELFLSEPRNRHVFSRLRVFFGRFVRGREQGNGLWHFGATALDRWVAKAVARCTSPAVERPAGADLGR
jgi:hypothetical protein